MSYLVYNQCVKQVEQCKKNLQEIEDELFEDLSNKLARKKILTNDVSRVFFFVF